MTIDTKLVLKVLYILTWIIFVGICIEAGGFIANAVFALFNPAVVKHLYRQVDLSDLFQCDKGHFFAQTLLSGIVLVLKAVLFYQIIKILHDKKLSVSQPFNKEMRRFVFSLSFFSLFIGLFSFYGAKYAEWLTSNGVKMPDIQQLRLGGADVWMFMAVILFVIAQIFKRGIEIQTENDLTV
ncbi:MAG: DUF2975 domain-containing protein [Chitinophagaceae bacterium]